VLFRNTAAATVALVTGYVFSFILAPIMLWRLGLAQFGVWAVTGAFASYAGLMDLGITRGLGRFIAFYHANGNRRAVEQLFTLGLIAVTCVAVVAGTGAFVAAPAVAGALDDRGDRERVVGRELRKEAGSQG
jgi:O-antigen/teichoic acid export membrane protein